MQEVLLCTYTKNLKVDVTKTKRGNRIFGKAWFTLAAKFVSVVFRFYSVILKNPPI